MQPHVQQPQQQQQTAATSSATSTATPQQPPTPATAAAQQRSQQHQAISTTICRSSTYKHQPSPPTTCCERTRSFGRQGYTTLMNTPTHPDPACLDTYKERLIASKIKTPSELEQMSDKQIYNCYLNHEQKMLESVSQNVISSAAKIYSRTANKLLPLDNVDDLEEDIKNDAFIQGCNKSIFSTYIL